MHYQGTSNSADQTEEEFPYLEFLKRPDRHSLVYEGRQVRSGCGTMWFNRTRVTGREDFRFYLKDIWIVSLMGKRGIIQGMHFEPGDLLLLPPKVEFEGSYAAGVELNVSLPHETLRAITSQSLPRVPTVLRRGGDGTVASGIRQFVKSGEGDPMQLCLSVLPDKPERLITPARRRLAAGIRDLIDAHLEEVCITDVCRRLGVSIRGAEIAFRAEFMETMRQYVTRTRLERARGLLLQGWSVTHAAQEVGWCHQGRFSAAFKNRYGVAPSLFSPDAIV